MNTGHAAQRPAIDFVTYRALRVPGMAPILAVDLSPSRLLAGQLVADLVDNGGFVALTPAIADWSAATRNHLVYLVVTPYELLLVKGSVRDRRLIRPKVWHELTIMHQAVEPFSRPRWVFGARNLGEVIVVASSSSLDLGESLQPNDVVPGPYELGLQSAIDRNARSDGQTVAVSLCRVLVEWSEEQLSRTVRDYDPFSTALSRSADRLHRRSVRYD